jgi:hypothetical protein
MIFKQTMASASLALALGLASSGALAGGTQGPSSSQPPYVIGVPPSVNVVSVLTVGDSVNAKPGGTTPYRMVGIPDGLGAYDNHDGTFTVLMNHELGNTVGVTREHGFAGAFVSSWIVRKSDLAVLHGGDLAKKVLEWNPASYAFQDATRSMGRLCSADLPERSAFYNAKTGKGYSGRIFMNGEEVGAEGRAFAHIATGPGTGISYELPYLGKFSWENSVASPYEQDKTVVIGLDDTTPGQLYVYVGEKKTEGSEIDKAGLQGGSLYGIKVAGIPLEDRAAGIPNGTPFSMHNFGDVSAKTGAQLQADSVAADVTQFLRPEDGAWDTRDRNVFYFVTTDRFDQVKAGTGANAARSRLYRLTFNDIRHPEFGGRIDTMLDGTEPQQMMDNMTVDADGNVLIQEDPGGQAHLATIWKFYPKNGALVKVAEHDPVRFGVPPTNGDEESSGIIEITDLLRRKPGAWLRDLFDRRHGDDDADDDFEPQWAKRGYRYYLGVVQAHSYELADPELVEDGQLFVLAVPKWVK